jgi:hypothetical protein
MLSWTGRDMLFPLGDDISNPHPRPRAVVRPFNGFWEGWVFYFPEKFVLVTLSSRPIPDVRLPGPVFKTKERERKSERGWAGGRVNVMV